MIVEVETETRKEFKQGMAAGADAFFNNLSGGVNALTVRDTALTGVDCIAMGTLTNDITAIDLSRRLAVEHGR